MKLEKLEPIDDGKNTQMTLSMSREDAQIMLHLFKTGKLQELGITNFIVSADAAVNAEPPEKWTKRSRRPKDSEKDGSAQQK